MPRPPEGSEVARCTACDTPAFKVGPDGAMYFKCMRSSCDTWHKVTAVLGLQRERDGRETAVIDNGRHAPRVENRREIVVEGRREEEPEPPRGGPLGPYRDR